MRLPLPRTILTKDEAKRTARVWRHTIGQTGSDKLIYEDLNELFGSTWARHSTSATSSSAARASLSSPASAATLLSNFVEHQALATRQRLQRAQLHFHQAPRCRARNAPSFDRDLQ
ncbi:MAG: hypothetical protein HC933_19705 [Pleurocapsa sp. SU_196_0]|nr:hypothetical protein [Pleurocapsa sp. SU_196_0]